MTHLKCLAYGLLALTLAACGPDGDSGQPEEAQTPAAADTVNAEDRDAELGEPEEAWSEPDPRSRELWDFIQENHSELTGEQQRALQACAELAMQDRDVSIEDAVGDCRAEIEEELEEAAEESQEQGGAG